MEQTVIMKENKPRNFVPELFSFENWESLKPFYYSLLTREIKSADELEKWLYDKSELESVVDEDSRWRYIRVTCDTNNVESKKAHEAFINEIKPHLIPIRYQLNKKMMECEFTRLLDKNKYSTLLTGIQHQLNLHEDENVELLTQLELKENEFPKITGNFMINHEGKDLTMPQASNLLQENNRELRETIYRKIGERRIQSSDELNTLYDELLQLRTQIATNVGFSNYRDYRMTELDRNDYTPYDCFQFHNSIRDCFLPLVNKYLKAKKEYLGLDKLRPWDTEVELGNDEPLKPFVDGEDLLNKTILCFNHIRPYFGDCLKTMKRMGRLDLDSRKGKSPGGYNMGLPESNVPFIFMNAASSVRDVITMVHEGGHAIHSFLEADLPLKEFKEVPSEIAELASMSMELISMEHWQIYFENDKDLDRAKLQLFQRIITVFLWVATIDKFQHWVFTNPTHTIAERDKKWLEIFYEFSSPEIDFTGLEDIVKSRWQSQIHLFEFPFYYIEYAIAQLGAIAMWKQYKESGEDALDNYMAALSLGYSRPLKDLYAEAGIKFDFSKPYIEQLTSFLEKEINQLLDKVI